MRDSLEDFVHMLCSQLYFSFLGIFVDMFPFCGKVEPCATNIRLIAPTATMSFPCLVSTLPTALFVNLIAAFANVLGFAQVIDVCQMFAGITLGFIYDALHFWVVLQQTTFQIKLWDWGTMYSDVRWSHMRWILGWWRCFPCSFPPSPSCPVHPFHLHRYIYILGLTHIVDFGQSFLWVIYWRLHNSPWGDSGLKFQYDGFMQKKTQIQCISCGVLSHLR